MSKTPENPPAFPCGMKINTSSDPLATPREVAFPGMTLRDWFAGQALAGNLADARVDISTTLLSPAEVVAKAAYKFADAMLEERGQ